MRPPTRPNSSMSRQSPNKWIRRPKTNQSERRNSGKASSRQASITHRRLRDEATCARDRPFPPAAERCALTWELSIEAVPITPMLPVRRAIEGVERAMTDQSQYETYVEVSGRRRIPGASQRASNLETSQIVCYCLNLLERDRAHQVRHRGVIRPGMVAEIHQRVD
jgi:hypothetical protein